MDARVALTLRTLGGLHDAGDRPRLPRPGADARPAARARQAQDPRRRHPVPRAARGSCCRSASTASCRPLPRLQRGLRGDVRRRAHPPGPVRRGDPPDAGRWSTLMPDEPEALGLLALMLLHDARREARIERGRRAGAARGPGPLALGPRRGSRRGRRSSSARCRCGRPGRTSCRRRSPRSTTRRPRPRPTDWAADRRALRGPRPARPVAGRGAQPRGRGRDGGRARRPASR